MFVDEAKIHVFAGNGGNGVVAFRREKYVPKGGPAGGNGGRGGHIIFKADPSLTTLLDFRFQQHFRAQNGEAGSNIKKHGRDGSDLILKVPIGTVIYEGDDTVPLADISHDGQEEILLRGGRGGRGNSVFANSTRQAPRFAEKGEPGVSKLLRLELKLLADVGLVGYPNVGKSTLVSSCSAAKPKIADYPFTTLVPNLGVVRVEDRSFVMADIPGLIEGAHEGQGLGHQFLRHIERTRVILHILDVSGATGREPIRDYRVIREELREYNPRLGELPQIVVFNKMDVPGAEEIAEETEAALKEEGAEIYRISAATGEGVQPLLYAALKLLDENPIQPLFVEPEEMEVIRFDDRDEERFQIHREFDGALRIEGPGVERRVAMTDMQSEEGVRRLHRQLSRLGVMKALVKSGAQEGDTVRVGDCELEYADDNAIWVK
jgi:GTP-binding protein